MPSSLQEINHPSYSSVERLLTKREVAKLLGVTERTIDNWRTEGRLQAVKLGPGVVRFDPQDIRSFIASSRDLANGQDGGRHE